MNTVAVKNANLLEDVEFLAGWGESWCAIAARLGRTPCALARQLHRLGRHDLVARLGGGRDDWQTRKEVAA